MRNNHQNTKIREGGRGRHIPRARADVPVQPMKTMVKQFVSADYTGQRQSRYTAACGGAHVETGPEGSVDNGDESVLKQFLKDCSLYKAYTLQQEKSVSRKQW